MKVGRLDAILPVAILLNGRESCLKAVEMSNPEMSNPSSIARPVQRAWQQDEYMEFCEEAEPILPGAIRVQPLDAPYTCGNFLTPVKALEEAPDGFR